MPLLLELITRTFTLLKCKAEIILVYCDEQVIQIALV